MAWAAGLFEGEGHINNHYGNTVQLHLDTTDLDVLERFKSIFECGTIYVGKKRQDHHKQPYKWVVSDRPNVRRVLGWMHPYMGERRRAAADEAFTRLNKDKETATNS